MYFIRYFCGKIKLLNCCLQTEFTADKQMSWSKKRWDINQGADQDVNRIDRLRWSRSFCNGKWSYKFRDVIPVIWSGRVSFTMWVSDVIVWCKFRDGKWSRDLHDVKWSCAFCNVSSRCDCLMLVHDVRWSRDFRGVKWLRVFRNVSLRCDFLTWFPWPGSDEKTYWFRERFL